MALGSHSRGSQEETLLSLHPEAISMFELSKLVNSRPRNKNNRIYIFKILKGPSLSSFSGNAAVR